MTNDEIRAKLLEHFDGHPERWTQGSTVDWGTGRGECLAVGGSLALHVSHDEIAKALGFAGAGVTDPQMALYRWNDAEGRTFDDVLHLLHTGEARP